MHWQHNASPLIALCDHAGSTVSVLRSTSRERCCTATSLQLRRPPFLALVSALCSSVAHRLQLLCPPSADPAPSTLAHAPIRR